MFNALNATTFGRFSETRAAREVIKPLVNAVVYLHQRGVVHRDIKPENILVAEGRIDNGDEWWWAWGRNERDKQSSLRETHV